MGFSLLLQSCGESQLLWLLGEMKGRSQSFIGDKHTHPLGSAGAERVCANNPAGIPEPPAASPRAQRALPAHNVRSITDSAPGVTRAKRPLAGRNSETSAGSCEIDETQRNSTAAPAGRECGERDFGKDEDSTEQAEDGGDAPSAPWICRRSRVQLLLCT